MSSPAANKSSSPKAKQKEKEKEKKAPGIQVHNQAERLKTVVRRLPSNLPEEVFWQSVEPWVTEETIIWKEYHPGKLQKRLNKENIPSRAYIAFKDEEQLALFSREYDGHLFRDKTGNESMAVVEFAPYQKIPTEKKKSNTRNATIDKDEDYLSFLESLKAPPASAEPLSLETLIAATQPPPVPKTTPLLEALKAEKSAHKDKEAILRNHAHYKEATSSGHGGKKEDSKKKPAPSSQKQPDPPPGSKKAKKAAQKAAQSQGSGAAASIPAGKSSAAAAAPPTPARQSAGPSVTPKASRGGREPRQPQQITSASAAVPAPSAQAPSTQAPDNADSVTAPTSPIGAPRRARPIIGLASRQFEAALNGAGVGVGVPGERKSRRERQRERGGEKEKDKDKLDTGNRVSEEQLKAKERGGRRKEDKPSHSGNTPKVPSILQRSEEAPSTINAPPSIMHRDGTSQAPRILARIDDAPVPGTIVLPSINHPPPIRGASRGGRGRGRGRGN